VKAVLAGLLIVAVIVVGAAAVWFRFLPAVGVFDDVDLEIVSTEGHRWRLRGGMIVRSLLGLI